MSIASRHTSKVETGVAPTGGEDSRMVVQVVEYFLVRYSRYSPLSKTLGAGDSGMTGSAKEGSGWLVVGPWLRSNCLHTGYSFADGGGLRNHHPHHGDTQPNSKSRDVCLESIKVKRCYTGSSSNDRTPLAARPFTVRRGTEHFETAYPMLADSMCSDTRGGCMMNCCIRSRFRNKPPATWSPG